MVSDSGMSILAAATAIPPDLIEIEFPSLPSSLHPMSEHLDRSLSLPPARRAGTDHRPPRQII
jgi:hypothetical protein